MRGRREKGNDEILKYIFGYLHGTLRGVWVLFIASVSFNFQGFNAMKLALFLYCLKFISQQTFYPLTFKFSKQKLKINSPFTNQNAPTI